MWSSVAGDPRGRDPQRCRRLHRGMRGPHRVPRGAARRAPAIAEPRRRPTWQNRTLSPAGACTDDALPPATAGPARYSRRPAAAKRRPPGQAPAGRRRFHGPAKHRSAPWAATRATGVAPRRAATTEWSAEPAAPRSDARTAQAPDPVAAPAGQAPPSDDAPCSPADDRADPPLAESRERLGRRHRGFDGGDRLRDRVGEHLAAASR